MPTDKKISELPVATFVNASDISVLVNGDTDYQYSFTLLLQFLEANLTAGANISFGTSLPQNTSGKNGDVFVNTAAGSFAQKASDTWTVVYTLPATNAADGTLLYGAGLPASATGKNLDSYINTLTGIFYKKSASIWSQVFSMATGPQGPQGTAGTNGINGLNGNSILSGSINPSNSVTGINGNFYINTTNYTLFGPKTAGLWGDAVSLLGAGVPNGGTAGQVLVKVDGTDFNTDWEDLLTDGGGGRYVSRAFNEILTFDVPFKMQTTQTGNIVFVLGSSPLADVTARIIITGDGVHSCTFPSDWINANGQVFDNTEKNIIYLEYDGDEALYSIIKMAAPDTTPPSLVSATIENAFKNKIVLIYSESLAAITPAPGDFILNLANVINNIVVAGSTVTIICADNFLNTDVVTVTYMPGTNKIQDPSGNLAAALTAHTLTNNVLAVNLSLSVLATNQIPKSTLNPAALAFGTGGLSGSDTPISISFWAKFISGTQLFINLQRTSTIASGGIFMYGGAGSVTTQIMGAGGLNGEAIQIALHTPLPLSIWQHIVLTYDGSKLNDGLKMYANGSLITTDNSNIGSYNGQVAFSSDHQLAIGGGVVSGTDLPATGTLMDEVFFWNIELSSAQVSVLYNAGSIIDPATLIYASNLIAGYKFDGDLIDIGLHGYDLTSAVAPTFTTDAP